MPERRQAADGSWYTLDEFKAWYSEKWALLMWSIAGREDAAEQSIAELANVLPNMTDESPIIPQRDDSILDGTDPTQTIDHDDTKAYTCDGLHKLHPAIAIRLRMRLEPLVVSIIISFLGDRDRCTLCDEGAAIPLRDGSGQWQKWCMDCALISLPDSTWPNIHQSSSPSLRSRSLRSRSPSHFGEARA